jgi:hypothetical protein
MMATLLGLKILFKFKVTILGLTFRDYGQMRGKIKTLCTRIQHSLNNFRRTQRYDYHDERSVLKIQRDTAATSSLLLKPPQATPGLWSLAQMQIPSTSSKLAQFTQNLSFDLFMSTFPFLGLNSGQDTEGPWWSAHEATRSTSRRSSRFAQSLQLSA